MVFGKKEVEEKKPEPKEELAKEPEAVPASEPVEAEELGKQLSESEKKRETWAINNAKNEYDRKAAWMRKQVRLGRMSAEEYKKAFAELKGE